MTASSLTPDLALHNGHIRTMDPARPSASAIAIKDARVVAVGDDPEVLPLAGSATRVVDLGGVTIVPGIVNAHNHLLATGRALRQVQLYGCRSIPEIQALVAEQAATVPPGTWIVGRGWDESLLAEGRHPTRHDLDAVAPNHPVLLHRVWNKLSCNSLALTVAGVSAETSDPPVGVLYAGSFERDAAGAPTGLYRDRAKEMILAAVPVPTEDELVEAIAAASAAYHAFGITAVAEPGLSPAEVRAFCRARREGRLSVRTDMLLAGWGFNPPEAETDLKERFSALGLEGGLGDDLLRLEGIKLMPDGGISDRTARMFEPYLDDPGNRGTWTVPPDELVRLIRWTHDLGWPMDIHTCGDEAQETTVRAFAAAQEANPTPWLRHRVHHAYFPTPESLRLMAAHAIPAVVSSPFLANLGEGFVNSLGAERAAGAMPMRTYLAAGVAIAGSSDSPITDFNPWVGMAAAVRRRTVTGRVLGAEEALTAEEALRSYTLAGAAVSGREGRLGSLAPSKLADLVVLDRDPLAIDPDELAEVRPVATMVGGAWVFGGV
ncbi:MAG: amidohydrolase [Chloroflexia bacterium]|nr:amidohydrolase [Chloroflexia bacterium]